MTPSERASFRASRSFQVTFSGDSAGAASGASYRAGGVRGAFVDVLGPGGDRNKMVLGVLGPTARRHGGCICNLSASCRDPVAIQYDFTRSWPQGMRFHVGGVAHCNAIL